MTCCQDDISTASATSRDEDADAPVSYKPVQSPRLDTTRAPTQDLEDISVQTPAFLAWTCDDGQTCSFPQKGDKTLTLDLRHIGGSAFFRLFTTILLKTLPNIKTKFYIHVHPEWVQALALDESLENIAEEATQNLGSSTTSLDFRLHRPPNIIGPQVDLIPRSSAYAQSLEQLRSLARSKRLTIFIPHTIVSKARLQSICEGITKLKTTEKDADLSRLYRGKGAQLLYSDLPLYADIEPSAPLPVDTQGTAGTRKRRRSPSLSSADSFRTPPGSEHATKLLGIVAKLERRLDSQDNLIEELQRKGEKRDAEMARQNNVIGELQCKVEQRDAEVARLARTIDEHECGQRDLQKEMDDMSETVDARVDDAVLDARLELEAAVNAKMADVEETIVRHVRAQRVSLFFQDYPEE